MLKSVRSAVLALLMLLPLCGLKAQQKGEGTDIHSNVRLVEMPIPQDMPEEFKAKYQMFVQQLKDAIKEKTSERTPADAFVFQVRPGIREMGANKTQRPTASVIAYRKDSKSEFRGDILLHNFATGGNIGKEDIDRFLAKQILFPLESE